MSSDQPVVGAGPARLRVHLRVVPTDAASTRRVGGRVAPAIALLATAGLAAVWMTAQLSAPAAGTSSVGAALQAAGQRVITPASPKPAFAAVPTAVHADPATGWVAQKVTPVATGPAMSAALLTLDPLATAAYQFQGLTPHRSYMLDTWIPVLAAVPHPASARVAVDAGQGAHSVDLVEQPGRWLRLPPVTAGSTGVVTVTLSAKVPSGAGHVSAAIVAGAVRATTVTPPTPHPSPTTSPHPSPSPSGTPEGSPSPSPTGKPHPTPSPSDTPAPTPPATPTPSDSPIEATPPPISTPPPTLSLAQSQFGFNATLQFGNVPPAAATTPSTTTERNDATPSPSPAPEAALVPPGSPGDPGSETSVSGRPGTGAVPVADAGAALPGMGGNSAVADSGPTAGAVLLVLVLVIGVVVSRVERLRVSGSSVWTTPVHDDDALAEKPVRERLRRLAARLPHHRSP